MKKIIICAAIAAVIALGIYAFRSYMDNRIYNNPAFAHGNGRLEATEVNITTKLSERIAAIHVNEGDYVKKGQVLAEMQTDVLKAELAQAKAKRAQAAAAKASANAAIELRKGELASAQATVIQKQSSLDGAKKRYERAQTLLKDAAMSKQQFENDETLYKTNLAELAAVQAKVKQAEAAVQAAIAESFGASANIQAVDADIARIEADLKDSQLTAPLDGRIQYRISEPGEVLGSGGKVLNLVDLSDVYMTFFLPEEAAGRVKIGADVRILLDAIPNIPIPAKVTFVSSVAQFTPKTVETQIERQKLMFRVKARINPELLKKYIEWVKTGLPGVAWVKINPDAEWPEFLQLRKDKK
jgi:HlyD family secretion protein